MDRNYISARTTDNRTILIDVQRHFPTANDYRVERLAEALQQTRVVQPQSVGIWSLPA